MKHTQQQWLLGSGFWPPGWRRLLWISVTAGVLLISWVSSAAAQQVFSATVTRIVDGDTLKVNTQGNEVTIRLVCLDAPEQTQTPWGNQSTQRLAHLVPPLSQVQLTEQGFDRYGRLLANVYTSNGEWVNLILIQEGLAVLPPQYLDNCGEMLDRLLETQEQAKTTQAGLWSDPTMVMPWVYRQSQTLPPDSAPGETPSPLPDCIYTDCDCAHFTRQIDAQRVLEQYPGDPHRLDRDNDGVACEVLP